MPRRTTGSGRLVPLKPGLQRQALPTMLVTHLRPLGGAEVLAGTGLGGDSLEIDAAVLVVGIELE